MKKSMSISALILATVLAGCSAPEGEGAAEHAGKQLDKAMENAKSYTDEKLKEAGKAIEETGKNLQKDG